MCETQSATLAALRHALAFHREYEDMEKISPTPLEDMTSVGSLFHIVREIVESGYALTAKTDEERVAMINLIIAYEGHHLDDAVIVALNSIRRGSTAAPPHRV